MVLWCAMVWSVSQPSDVPGQSMAILDWKILGGFEQLQQLSVYVLKTLYYNTCTGREIFEGGGGGGGGESSSPSPVLIPVAKAMIFLPYFSLGC